MNLPGKILDILCDPISKSNLFHNKEDKDILKSENGNYYPINNGIPNLLIEAASKSLEKARSKLIHYDAVRDHYDKRPCYNYLCLDNVPLGKYLRENKYDYLFSNCDTVVEVGSGRGAIASAFKEYRGITPICIDQAYGSLRHVRKDPLNAPAIQGSNLALPIKDNSVDLVISYGVIHHTPNTFKCLNEFARILKPGGKLFLNVYNWENFYRILYAIFNGITRIIYSLLGKKIGDTIIMLTLFPPYYLLLWLVLGFIQHSWRLPNIKNSWEQFHDFFTTPIAKFYFKEEMQSMVESLGFKMLEYDPGGWPGGNFAHFYWFEKL